MPLLLAACHLSSNDKTLWVTHLQQKLSLMENPQLIRLLQEGQMELEGRISWGSNYTLLGRVCLEDEETTIIYKPQRGERPLWDFPSGTLCNRERAAYLVSHHLNWNIVPPTVLRNGEYGWGSVQLFIDHDPNMHYFNFQGEERYDSQLKKIALFDLITNNADRKGGHVLVDENDQIWAIDHGICFHAEYKLRSVIWEYASEPIDLECVSDLEQFCHSLAQEEQSNELKSLLSQPEVEAVLKRATYLVDHPVFPEPGPGRHYPWPPV